MIKLYLLSPYSHPKESTRIWRWTLACERAGLLMQRGFLVYSPIAHTHPIAAHCNMPKGWDFWERYDRTFIEDWSDAGVLLKLPGWEKSVGISAEIEIFKSLNKPVFPWDREEELPHGLKAGVGRLVDIIS